MARNDLASLVVKLEAQTAQYMAGMERAERKADSFRKRTTSALDGATSAFKAFGRAIAAGFTLHAIESLIDKMDALQESAKAANVGTDAWQAWGLAAKQAGVDSAAFASAMQRANKYIGDAASGKTKEASAFFYKLGISVRDASGHVRQTEDVIKDFSDKLHAMGDSALQASYSSTLFGRGVGTQLAPAISGGAAALDNMIVKAKELGLVVSKEALKAADDFNDTLATLSTVTFAAFAESIAPALPLLSQLAQKFGEATGKSIAFFASIPEWWRTHSDNRPFSQLDSMTKGLTDFSGVGSGAGALLSGGGLPGLPGKGTKPAVGVAAATDAFADAAAAAKATMTAQERAIQDMGTAVLANLKDEGYAMVQVWSGVHVDMGHASEKLADLSKYNFDRMTVFAEQAARNMQDTLADFLFDPFDDGLKGMLSGLVDVLRRMVAEMAAADLFGALGGIGGGGGGVLGAIGGFFRNAVARADGGAVTAGSPYMVGERGPEWFIPNANGSIMPNGGGNITINQSIVAQPGTDAAALHAVMIAAKNSAIAEIDSRTRRTRGRR